MSYAKYCNAAGNLADQQRALLINLMMRTDSISVLTTAQPNYENTLKLIAQDQMNIATGFSQLGNFAPFTANLLLILNAPARVAVAAALQNNTFLFGALCAREKRMAAKNAKLSVKGLQKREARERRNQSRQAAVAL